MSLCGTPTEKIFQFVEYHLNPPFLSQGTTDVLLKLQSSPNNLPDDTILVTLRIDVTSLHTNIPHSEGIEVCTEALNSRVLQQPPTEDLVELIKQILTKNNFVNNDEHYLKSTAQPLVHVCPPYMLISSWET